MLQLSQRALSASAADGELFVLRGDERERIRRALGLGFNVYVLGEPGSGKTSLLRRFQGDQLESFVHVGSAEELAELIAHLGAFAAGTDPGQPPRFADVGTILRHVGQADANTAKMIVTVDANADDLLWELFGRLRDELWEMPVRWLASGRSPLRAPADSFFELVHRLPRLDRASMIDVLARRSTTASEGERELLEQVTRVLPDAIGESTPRHLLSMARAVVLAENPDATLRHIVALSEARRSLSDTANAVLDAFAVIGPTYAGDQRLLDEIGMTRNRIVQVLGELEEAGLVISERAGRRKLYRLALGESG